MSFTGVTEIKRKLVGKIHLLREIPGFSAYELAVKHGYKGTEEEWLAALKGEKGEAGTLQSHTEVDALGHRVINVAEPEADTDAVNLGYIMRMKLTGTYEGNYSSEKRTINIGETTSKAVLVYNYYTGCATILTYNGGFGFKVGSDSDGNTVGVPTAFTGNEAYFRDGNIILRTTDTALNAPFETYTYQVL